ncbi:small multi-drug export protein [Patescibacteria group bacterium]|nr:small multi-drug export protein [Patescibacteria group bacterium]
MPLELKVFLIAMSPIVELRGAIPIALGVYQMPIWSAYLFSVLGNLVPLILIIWLLEPVSQFFSRKFYFFNRLFSWLFAHTRAAHQSKFEKWGKNSTVIILTAIPIPFVGGWTGAISAFVFGIPFKKALPLVIIGCLLAGVIVTLMSLGFLKLI